MSDTVLPFAEIVAIDGNTVQVRCPYCGDSHLHGLEPGETSTRLSHCRRVPAGRLFDVIFTPNDPPFHLVGLCLDPARGPFWRIFVDLNGIVISLQSGHGIRFPELCKLAPEGFWQSIPRPDPWAWMNFAIREQATAPELFWGDGIRVTWGDGRSKIVKEPQREIVGGEYVISRPV